jgi:predicted GTPase
MKRILITGMSGTGKSSAIRELLARGHHAHDLDTPEAGTGSGAKTASAPSSRARTIARCSSPAAPKTWADSAR